MNVFHSVDLVNFELIFFCKKKKRNVNIQEPGTVSNSMWGHDGHAFSPHDGHLSSHKTISGHMLPNN